jgi:ATPase subunit of ABC transporter with duplicated ATPase domains
VFDNLNLSFDTGWTALIGANGAGKSTLIKLLSGELNPDSGFVNKEGDAVVCPQTRDAPPDCFFDGEILNKTEFFSLLAMLEIEDDWIERWPVLSGGEKKRCVIADVLIREPPVLILDEPANHIDARTAGLLLSALAGFRGTGIIVSHNMAFIDSLAKSSVLLIPSREGASRAFSFQLSPLAAIEEFEKIQAGRRELKSRLSSETRGLERSMREAVCKAETEKRRGMSKKYLDPHDSSGREKVNLARLSGRDRTGGKKAAMLKTALNRKEAELSKTHAIGQRKTGARLHGRRCGRPTLFFIDAGVTPLANGALTLEHPALEIKNDSHIVISGCNGAGKSSLLRFIADNIKTSALELWHLPQELSEDERKSALERLHALNETEKGAALSVIYRLGSEPAPFLAPVTPSPGEARKLHFALAMLRGAALIMLDEPTNHMDAVSAAALADAINEFEGAAIIITHDAAFAKKTGRIFWNIDRNEKRAVLNIAEPHASY